MRNIILAGFMGTGKTTVGKLLAEQLNYQFVDTDAMIEASANRSIKDIFDRQGEDVFRAMETAVAQELSQYEGLLISTGGGMMLNLDNVVVLEETGDVFCLVATADEIFARIMQDGPHIRPLLAGENPKQRIAEILQERQEGYGRFTQIQTTGKQPADVASDILTIIGEAE